LQDFHLRHHHSGHCSPDKINREEMCESGIVDASDHSFRLLGLNSSSLLAFIVYLSAESAF